MSKRFHIRAAVLAALCVALLPLGAHATAAPAPTVPDPDPFYAAPADIADHAPGDVLQSRRADAWMYPNTDVWQLKYRSTNSAGAPVAAVTTVLMPRGHGAGTPLVSYQAVINALGVKCAPSHGLFTYEIGEAPSLYLGLVARGWAVAVPDYLGPNGAYGAAEYEGRLTLDGVRAVTRFEQLPLADSPVALVGYSGGALATSWASAMAPTYAPELNIVGTAQGGIPADLGLIAQNLGYSAIPHPAFGMALAASLGLEREYPTEFPVSPNLNATGLALRDRVSNECRRSIILGGAFRSARDLSTVDIASLPSAQAVLRKNSLVDYPGVPTAPVYMWQGRNDFITPFAPVEATVKRYCESGATVEFRPYPLAEHFSGSIVGLPEAYAYIEARFRGEPAPSNC
ncbi:lipase [Rhodococcoides trifolii]|uniref:Lipase n=1 Tax=Rhodococcoides trifolii TaxID=908250 RepID=A0A917G5L0_9NOCA|nr:lipase family protein [Rhodococcus trifolii]GGG24393.1 lipase [Rhodococcus trifolii]